MPDNITDENPALAAFPQGVILPWYSKGGPFPGGWAVCDGTNGTPDLRGRFLMGVSDMADVGNQGGRNPFPARECRTDDLGNGSDWVIDVHEGAKATSDLRPPFDTVLFMMKL